MQIVITAVKEITSKKSGDKFLLVNAIKPNGETLTAFLDQEKRDRISLPPGSILNQEQLAEMFKVLPVVEVTFNELGRLEDIVA